MITLYIDEEDVLKDWEKEKLYLYQNDEDDTEYFLWRDKDFDKLNWFEENTSESRLAKYWASEEMAEEIWYRDGWFAFDYLSLSQLLKKEWFR